MDGNIPVMHGMPIAALCRQDGLTGSAWGDLAQYTDSPLRAFEKELGVQVGQKWARYVCWFIKPINYSCINQLTM